ncbi:MAG: hypothetical protein J7545_18140 [Roseofilum sp. SBFL]|uniref:hypothetical protein n=1 Tax=unclassified Roseofilum TaxID=2620099 RepID=UPI001B1E5823|nr:MULTISPECIES: hypothetical protein [unclassified Roseofilum]MBP0014215.1 hypothetical protein [Roseofilum sp. SID3]MBP0025000.1 hypothetical protein [Roseofilum sp. SID2]MBP0036935.1 hypothetical protein [Roseofilum sp. SID1]MBP0043869.1 hypothetical protein [Roseofilum sp. SBFL]
MGNFTTIDPTQGKVPEIAVVEKVFSENDRLPEEEHEKAVHAFFTADGIASGISKDLAFVDKIPQLIDDILENKSWECVYIARGVVTPYYCRYVKGTDSDNFRAFITAKRPNGLGTTIETVDRLLEPEPEIKRKFRTLIYESRQGERLDLIDPTSGGDCPKLDLAERQQKTLRAANRAATAIPAIGKLLDRELIAIDIAAKLGRNIKNPDNLTADEREYVESRDLIGLRIDEYIKSNPIPEDEYKEPAYRRELNRFVKDLLGIKDRSKQVRMDNPKKAAEKLLQFYTGEKLQELLDHLQQGLELPSQEQPLLTEKDATAMVEDRPEGIEPDKGDRNNLEQDPTPPVNTTPQPQEEQEESSVSPTNRDNSTLDQQDEPNYSLNTRQLAERLKLQHQTIMNMMYNKPEQFPQWSQERDPEGIAWQRSSEKNGKLTLFSPVLDNDREDEPDAIENGV